MLQIFTQLNNWIETPQGLPLTYFPDGGGKSEGFFGSEILAKSFFLLVYVRHRDCFWVAKITQ